VTDPRDPIEAWLSSDVELLSPPPGTYQRVRRRARRRKAVRTMSAAAGAAVIVAAAAVLPQVAGNLLSGPGGPYRAGGGTSTHRHTGQRKSEPAPRPSPTSRTLTNGGQPISSAGSGPPAPGFRPTSVTFVGTYTGAVIGQAGSSCSGGPCTAVAGTHDYGSTWAAIGAPPATPPNGSAGVSQIRFLGLHNGWAYGPALYATHDGGHRWTAITGLPGRVIDLATVGHRAFAVVAAGCSGTNYWENCASYSLFSTVASSDSWRPVGGASTTSQVVPGGLQLTGKYGYLVTNGLLYTGPVTGADWHQVPTSSPTAPPCLTPQSGSGPWLIAPNGAALYLVCTISRPNSSPSTALSLYASADQGRTWQAQGAVPVTGTATSLAASPAGTLVLATTAGLYYSPDGHTWRPAALDVPATGSGGFSFVGMTTATSGVAVPSGPGSRELYITKDGGQSWQHSPIR
jgi:photosystem II stability/assembly factor-like uncharacterized protein